MKIIFYSEQCNFSKKLLDYINKNNLIHQFKLINIDNIKNIPSNIDSVPTIIDTDLNQYLKSKKVFEYIVNIKYFNNPTNNIEYAKNIPNNPLIIEDNKAFNEYISNLELDNKEPLPNNKLYVMLKKIY